MAQLEEVPHLTLRRLKDLLAARGIAVSHDTVWRFLRREGRSFKKNALASEQHRADVARRRQRWQRVMSSRSGAPRLHRAESASSTRRDLDQDQHGTDPRLGH
jgi:hypothetical protein